MKDLVLAKGLLEQVVSEFEEASVIGENKIDLGKFSTINCEEEKFGFDTFVNEKGNAFSGLPGLPLPFKVIDNILEVFPCTEEYGLTKERGLINLKRSLRFFLMEIYENKLHIKTNNLQVHPLD